MLLPSPSSTLFPYTTLFRSLKNRGLLFALYRHAWELREEAQLLGHYVRWLQTNRGTEEAFVSPDRRPKIYRGGLAAELQRLLPMDKQGRFHTRLPTQPRPHGTRSV